MRDPTRASAGDDAARADYLIEQREKFRELLVWVDPEGTNPRRRITLLRPPEAEATAFLNGYGPDLVAHYARGWAGWRERDIMPGGGDDDVPFIPRLVRDVLADDLALLKICGDKLTEAINNRYLERKALRGNSSST
jgi:hypothetical protein